MSCVEKLEHRLNKHSGNSDKPSSSNSPFRKSEAKPVRKRADFRQKMPDPTAVTDNHAERLLRFPVIWHTRSFGTRIEQRGVFAERLLSFRQTCHLQGKRTYSRLVKAFERYLSGIKPAVFFSGTRETCRSVNSARSLPSLSLSLKLRIVTIVKAVLAVLCQDCSFSFFVDIEPKSNLACHRVHDAL